MIVQLKFEGAQADFVKRASEGKNRSALCRAGILRAAAAVLGEDIPEGEPRKGPEAGSRDPVAKALNLSTGEYRRRLGKLASVGNTEPTPEQILAVPAAKKRQAKVNLSA